MRYSRFLTYSHLCSLFFSCLCAGLCPEVAMLNMSLSLGVTSLVLFSCQCEPLLRSLNTPPYQHGSDVQAAPLSPASYCVLPPPIGQDCTVLSYGFLLRLTVPEVFIKALLRSVLKDDFCFSKRIVFIHDRWLAQYSDFSLSMPFFLS